MKFIALLLTSWLGLTGTSSAAPWVEVVPDLKKQLVRDFLAPESEYGSGHRGIDFLVRPNEPVSSPVDGEVYFVGKVVNRSVITIRGFDGSLASFEPVCSDLDKFQEVAAGEVIGTWCKPDQSYLPHCEKTCVHLSARVASGYLNPLWLMRHIEPSRLMPWDGLADSLP